MTYELLYGNKSTDNGKSTLTPWSLEEYLAIERGHKSAAWHMYNWQKLRILGYGREHKWTNASEVQQLTHDARVAFVTRICDGKTFDEEVCEALFVRFTKWYFQYRNNPRKWSTARYPDPAAMTATIADYNRRASSTSIPDAGLSSASRESLHDDDFSGSDTISAGPVDSTFQSDSQQTDDQHELAGSVHHSIRPLPVVRTLEQEPTRGDSKTSNQWLAHLDETLQSDSQQTGDRRELAGSVHPSGRLQPVVRTLEQKPTHLSFYGDSKTANQWLAHLDEILPYPFTSQDDVDRWVTGFEASLRGLALQWATEHADDILEADHVTLDTAQKLRSNFLRKFGFDVNTYDGSAKPTRWLRQLDNALENFSELPEYSAIWLEIFAASMRGPAKQWACDDSHIRQLKSRASDSIGKQHVDHVKARFLSCFPCDSHQTDLQGGKRAGKKPARDESPGADDDFSSSASKEADGEEEDVVPENVVEAADALSEILEGLGLH